MSGDKTAVEMALQATTPEDEAEQLELAELGLPRSLALEQLQQRKAGPGRPPGARNKRTLRTVEFLLAQFRDPRAVLLQIAQTPIDELAASLGCKPLEALQEIRNAAATVLPYVAQRQPLAVDITDRKVVYLNIIDAEMPAGDDGIGLVARVLEHQALSEDDRGEVGQSEVGQEGQTIDAP